MASTNSTTHYELSQYIGTDKPTYLVDYNQDMSKIDTGIYDAKSEADTNKDAIGTLSNLTTTVKTDLVSAINEVDSETSSIGNISNLTTTVKTDLVSAVNEVNGKTDNIGVLANLTTTEKSNLVGAINEVDGDIGDLVNLTTTAKTNVVSAINEVNSKSEVIDNMNGNETDKAPSVHAMKVFLEGTVLYSDTTGTKGTVTLSDNISNYEFLEIFYESNGYESSKKVDTRLVTKFILNLPFPYQGAYYDRMTRYTISGNEITFQEQMTVNNNFTTVSSSSNVSDASIFIKEVIGFKY